MGEASSPYVKHGVLQAGVRSSEVRLLPGPLLFATMFCKWTTNNGRKRDIYSKVERITSALRASCVRFLVFENEQPDFISNDLITKLLFLLLCLVGL